MSDWQFFKGHSDPHPLEPIVERPAWRQFMSTEDFDVHWRTASVGRWSTLRKDDRLDARSSERGKSFQIRQEEEGRSEILSAVNSALALRRPLLITGHLDKSERACQVDIFSDM